MMKRKYSGLILVLMIATLAACGSSDESQGEAAKPATEAVDHSKKAGAEVVSTKKPGAGLAEQTTSSDPNPIRVCDGSGLGQTTISWDAPGVSSVEVRIHSPTGRLMASGQKGSTQTGKWVKDGMAFFLVDASNGEVLDKIVVEVTQKGCP